MYGVLYSHSFGRRLLDYLNIHHYGHTIYLSELLKIEEVVDVIAIEGYRGAKLKNTRATDILLDRPVPSFVILDIGSNDIEEVGGVMVAEWLMQLAEELMARGVEYVLICSVLVRGPGKARHVDWYNNEVRLCNDYVNYGCSRNEKAVYYQHVGFWNHPINTWSNDNLHPKMDLYFKNIRRAFFTAGTLVKVSVYNDR